MHAKKDHVWFAHNRFGKARELITCKNQFKNRHFFYGKWINVEVTFYQNLEWILSRNFAGYFWDLSSGLQRTTLIDFAVSYRCFSFHFIYVPIKKIYCDIAFSCQSFGQVLLIIFQNKCSPHKILTKLFVPNFFLSKLFNHVINCFKWEWNS